MKIKLMIISLISVIFITNNFIYADESEQINIVYFYINACESCHEAENIINNYLEEIESLDLDEKVNFISHNTFYKYHNKIFFEYLDYYQLDSNKISTPLLFIGGHYYYGESAINEGLKNELMLINQGEISQTPLLVNNQEKDNEDIIYKKFKSLQFLNMFFIGFVNGLNPCSLSMLLFLLSILLVKNKNIMKYGLTFVLGKFISFLLLGTIMYNLLSLIHIEKYLMLTKVLMSIFIIILASSNIYDFVVTKQQKYGSVVNQLPSKLRGFNHNVIKRISNIKTKKLFLAAIFILGMIIAIGEFLCTGQIYITTIVFMIKMNNSFSIVAFIYLLIYSVGFVVPMVLMIIGLSRINNLFEVSESLRYKLPYIKLITAIILMIFGIVNILL